MRLITAFVLLAVVSINGQVLTYKIIDTGQEKTYNETVEISAPQLGEDFYGQDAQHNGLQPAYQDNGDGTVTDLNTGLMWQANLLSKKYTYSEALAAADTFSLAGYNDWRLPSIKEIYSLMNFSGITGIDKESTIPYVDTTYFDFRFGDDYNPSERYIDAQWATTTAYVNTVFDGEPAMFGLNLADGRIKGYPQTKEFEVFFVRGNEQYGINNFTDNGDGTITDSATGLMWDQEGSSTGMIWKDALQYAQDKNDSNYLGYNDWRLPNAKELQSLLDYTRSPGTTNSAAIDPLFNVPVIKDEGDNDNYPFYWTSTTHFDGPMPNKAVYICFGEALGFMEDPPNSGSGNYELLDVHGAGAQRSDPKTGDPDNYPNGFGPQGDVIRIYNYVRLVRDADITVNIENEENIGAIPNKYELEQNYPNPFNPSTTISFSLPESGIVSLKIFDVLGREVDELVNKELSAGKHTIIWNAGEFPSGVYFYNITTAGFTKTNRMILLK